MHRSISLSLTALLYTEPSHASYLIEPSITAGLARSQEQCAALGCDGDGRRG
jgi:hypothetical protein